MKHVGCPIFGTASKLQSPDMAMLEEICERTGATKVHHIGKQLVIYRQAETAKIVIPK
jgi:RNA-binding protein YhbY